MGLDIDRLKIIERVLMRESFDIACLSLGLAQVDRRPSDISTLERIAAAVQTHVERGDTDAHEIARAAIREIASSGSAER